MLGPSARGPAMDRRRSRLSRRGFVLSTGMAGFGLLAGCGRLPWQAQPSAKVFRIGFLAGGGVASSIEAFQQGLRELGYVEGQNLTIAYRFSDGTDGQLPLLAADLVSLEVDVIVAV